MNLGCTWQKRTQGTHGPTLSQWVRGLALHPQSRVGAFLHTCRAPEPDLPQEPAGHGAPARTRGGAPACGGPSLGLCLWPTLWNVGVEFCRHSIWVGLKWVRLGRLHGWMPWSPAGHPVPQYHGLPVLSLPVSGGPSFPGSALQVWREGSVLGAVEMSAGEAKRHPILPPGSFAANRKMLRSCPP